MLQMSPPPVQQMKLSLLCMVIFPYAIGNNPIPIFGLDGMIIPFGSNRDIGVYPLHVRLDKSALPEHAAATALLFSDSNKIYF